MVNFGSNNVTVIDGLSNTTATVAAGSSPVAVASSPSTASIKAGETATFTLTITPTGGFNSPVSVSCSGLPALATCTLTPASVTPKGSPVTATLALKTTGPNAALQMPDLPGEKRHRCLQFGCSMAHCGQPRWSLAGISLLGILLTILGCGGGGPRSPFEQSQSPQTLPGISTIIVTASANGGSTIHTTTVSLTVTQ